MTEAVVIGQSHSEAVAQALSGECAAWGDIRVYRLADSKRPFAGGISLSEATAIVAGLPAETVVFLSMLGTYHNILGMLRSGDSFDVLLNSDDQFDPLANVLVPQRALALAFEQHFEDVTPIKKIKGAAKSRPYLLSSPPPKQSNEFMLQRLMSQKDQFYRGKSIREAGLERPESRLKLWKLETTLTSVWARSCGMEFVPAPSDAFDESGFLRAEFYSEDATHANAEYGALVVRQMCDIIGQTKQETMNG